MKYSTLTTEELQESYRHLLPKLDFAVVEAGLTRHEVDWLYGINLSRALTQSAKSISGNYATLSTGRVQGPTLRFLEEREKEIQCFVPTPYWTLTAKIAINDFIIDVTFEKPFETLAEATKVKAACKTKEGKIETVDVTEVCVEPAGTRLILGALQSEAYKLFHLTPMRTSIDSSAPLHRRTRFRTREQAAKNCRLQSATKTYSRKLGKASDYS